MLTKNKLLKLKQEVVEVSRKKYALNFSAPNDGNVSFKYSNRIFITASNKHKNELDLKDILEIDAAGKVLGLGKASTENAIHLRVYQKRPEINAVVHAHPPYATAFAVAHIALDLNSMSEVISSIGAVPLAPYGTPSTKNLPDSIDPYINNCNAILMANHGLITYGTSLTEAWQIMERVEHFARISYYARALGGEKELNEKDLEELLQIRKKVYNHSAPILIKKGNKLIETP